MSETIALEALVEVLVEQGLIDALSPEQLEELVEDTFNGDVEELEDWAAAAILQTVYAERSGAERGVVHHDHRFGSETSDVVAELSATLGGWRLRTASSRRRRDRSPLPRTMPR